MRRKRNLTFDDSRSGVLSFFLIPAYVADMADASREVNVTCKEDEKVTLHWGLAWLVSIVLLGFWGAGIIVYLVYMARMIKRLEMKVRRCSPTKKPEFTAKQYVLFSIFSIFTFFILDAIAHFRFYKLWNQVNGIYREEMANQGISV